MTRKEKAALLAASIFQCEHCKCDFRPTRLTSRFCSRACGDVVRKRKYRQTDKGKECVKQQNIRRLESKREWERSQPTHKRRELVRQYQAKKKGLTPKLSSIERQMIKNYYLEAQLLSEQTGVPHEVDHIIPLCRGGWHHPFNLQVLPRYENRVKSGRI